MVTACAQRAVRIEDHIIRAQRGGWREYLYSVFVRLSLLRACVADPAIHPHDDNDTTTTTSQNT